MLILMCFADLEVSKMTSKKNKLTEPTMNVIKMAALGRPVYLGQLYDAIKDSFVGKIMFLKFKNVLIKILYIDRFIYLFVLACIFCKHPMQPGSFVWN